jgi:ribose 5-phosphate isomerase A
MKQEDIRQNSWKQLAGEAAAKLVEDGMAVGIGTGSTASHFIYALARRINEGLHIVGGIPSSRTSKELAESLGIPIADLDRHPQLDLYVDGADEIDPQLQLIKGAGGALLREKIVASVSRRFVVIGDITKQVTQLGHLAPLPVETIAFAVTPVKKRIEALGAYVQIRQAAGEPFITENNNIILDCTFPDGIADPTTLDSRLHSIVGVVETGLFLHMAQQAIIGGPEGVKILP